MGNLCLVSFDTDHIKQYVFPSDKLREIRGASSILDCLNRETMNVNLKDKPDLASQVNEGKLTIYANGGSAMLVMEKERVDPFCQLIQKAFHEQSKGALSVSFAIQALPEEFRVIDQRLLEADLGSQLELLRYKLQAQKDRERERIALPSHPFMRTCDACGTRYAEGGDAADKRDPNEQGKRYCASCLEKRGEDKKVKASLERYLKDQNQPISKIKSPIWRQVIEKLRSNDYPIPEDTERPNDFNDFQQFADAKGYMGLIYADGNGMGKVTSEFKTLQEWHNFAGTVDGAIYEAVCDAIQEHLPVVMMEKKPLFPFDLLVLGGDDVLMVTPAALAMDVALTIAKRFREITFQRDRELYPDRDPAKAGYTLSVGVILAPAKYPFGLLLDLAEDTLKFAKKEGTKRWDKEREQYEQKYIRTPKKTKEPVIGYRDTSLNFMTVTGSTSQAFKKVYGALREKHGKVSGHKGDVGFYATLRPYTVEGLEYLLGIIRDGKEQALGRTKLHQVREAILQMNLASSVTEGLGVLRNWRQKQRDFVMKHVYTLGGRYQERYRDEDKPETHFPRVTFPWFADGPDTYRTSLLDFVELYDFVGTKNRRDKTDTQAEEVSHAD